MTSAERFYQHFLAQLAHSGTSPEQAAKLIWRPFDPAQQAIFGPERDRTLDSHTPSPQHVGEVMAAAQAQGQLINEGFFRDTPIALILVPGYTHETLRHYAWHEDIDDSRSPHNIVVLHADDKHQAREEQRANGDGLRMAYLRYPRSNAATEQIVPAMARMLDSSPTVQSWIDEGRKLIFVGYSYGSPLSLKLLCALQQGREKARGVLSATTAMLALCGDVGGAYLADDVLSDDPKMFSLDKVIAFCQRHRWAAKLAGLGTPQLMADFRGGVEALGHERRQAELAELAQLPPQLHYYSLAAMLPLSDYRRHWWQLNIDDIAMYRQAQITDPITVYNDGQVALPDNLIPALDHVAPDQQHFLGAVRTHHWGVSYRTFNFGRNRFPRRELYRALVHQVCEDAGLMDTPS